MIRVAFCLFCVLTVATVGNGAALAAPRSSPELVGPTPTPAPLVYTADSNKCERDLPPEGGGGAGREISGLKANAAVLLKLDNQGDHIWQAYFSPDGRTIVTQGENALRFWDASSGRRLKIIGDSRGFRESAFAPDGKTIAAVVGDGSIQILNVASGRAERSITVPKAVGVPGDDANQVWTPAYSRDGRRIATARGSVAYVFDATTGRELLRLKARKVGERRYAEGHAAAISALRFSPNDQVLLTAGGDASVRMWDLSTGKQLRCYGSEEQLVYERLDISPDGRQIAATAYARLRQWDALTGRLVREIQAPNLLTSLSFSPDGRSLLVGGLDFTARLWDVRTGELTGLMRHPDWVMSVAFSPDGRRVVTALETPVAWVWDATHRYVTLAAQSETLQRAAIQLAARGDIGGAQAKLRQAVSQNPDPAAVVPGAKALNALCWFGALYGMASEVLGYCDQAVGLDSSEPNYRDSRGVARALLGDLAGAIEEFTFVVDRWQLSPPENADWLPKREQWLISLQAGMSPFDAATLQALRDE